MDNKKTIIIGVFLREQSALSEYFLKMADELVKLNYHVIVITDENKTYLVDKKNNPMVLTWPSYHPNKFQDFIFIKNLIIKYKPKMLISNFTATNLFLIVGKLYGVPYRISWIHTVSTALHDIAQWRIWRKKYVFKLATHCIANSNATKLDAIKTYDIIEDKITVIPNLINKNDLYINKNKDWKITFIGRFHISKGVDVLIKAMSIVVKEFPTIKLDLIGGGDQTFYIELVRKYSLEKNIIFLGELPRDKVLKSLSKSQFSIVPSIFEAFGYVVIEAFSVKTPVIGSNTGGILDIIENGKSGFLFSVGNYNELASKMILMLKDENLRKKCADYAHDTFINKYELNKNIKETIDLFHEIIQNER